MKQKLLHSFTLRVCLLVALFANAVSGAWAESYEYTFESDAWSQNGSATLNNVSWTLNMEGGTISNFSSTQGMHFGTNKSTCNSVTISSSGISGTITSVKVEASRGSSLVGTLGIKVGSTAFKVNNSETNALTTSNAEYDFTGNDNGNIEIKWTTTSGKGAYYIKKITITYSTSGNLTTSDLAITGAPVALSFDLYDNAAAQTVSYTTSSTGEVTVSGGEGYVTTSVDATNKTITVTPTAVTPSAQTITVSQAADETYAAGEVTFTVFVDDTTPTPTHTATFNINGVTSSDDVEEGAEITFPADPADQEGKVFLGWTTSAIEGTTNEAPTMVTSATMGNADVTYYAVFANRIAGTLVEVTDELTNANTINGTGTNYKEWTATGTSGAVYAGLSAGGYSAIQLRTTNSNEGIVSTTSGGKATKVTVEWNSNTADGRELNIYGKSSSKYNSAADLYESALEPIGTIGKNSTTFTLPYHCDYIGIRSKSGALYLDKVSITWSNGGTPDSYSDYCTTVVADTRAEAEISFTNTTVTKGIGDSYTGEVLTNPNSLSVSYTSSNEGVATVNASTGVVTLVGPGETTITASFAGNESYKAGSASYTLNVKGDAVIVVQDEDVVYGSTFTVDDSMIEGGDITVTSSNTAIATVSGLTITPVAVGTTTITVATAENATYMAGSETFELTVTAPEGKTTAAAATETVFEETFDESTGTNSNFGDTGDAAGTLITDNEGWSYDEDSKNGADSSAKFGAGKKKGGATTPSITVTSGNNYTLTFKAAPWADEESTLTLTLTGGTINNETSITTETMTARTWNNYSYTITATSTVMTIKFAASNNRFFLDDVKVTTAGDPLSVTLNATTGYATYCSVYPLDFSDDSEFSAWEITNIEGTTITFNQITGTVKGGTGVFLKGTAGATVTLTSAASTTELGSNLLEGTTAPTYVTAGEYFGLKGNEFVPVNAGTIPAGKALLPASVIPAASGVKAFTFVFVNTATGMRTVETVSAEDAKAIFNLAGQRLSKIQRGINIVNGKKVVVK